MVNKPYTPTGNPPLDDKFFPPLDLSNPNTFFRESDEEFEV